LRLDIININELKNGFETFIKLLPPKRRKKACRYVKMEDRLRSLGGGLLMRAVLGVKSDEDIVYGQHAKPCLRYGELHFNLSHSGDYVILVSGACRLGVDIEKISNFESAVARRCFTDQECAELFKTAQNTKESNLLFFKLWTAKESIMKASGLGFNLPPESFTVIPFEDMPCRVNGEEWFLKWNIINGHIYCLAAEYTPDFIDCKLWSADELNKILSEDF